MADATEERMGNTESRPFGVVRKAVHQTECQQQQQPATKPPSQKSTAVATPAASNVKGNPVVTTEKSRGATTNNSNAKNNIDEGGNFEVLITCPNGLVINLCPRHHHRHVILGRGVHGIPHKSDKVPYQSCVVRIMEKSNVEELAKNRSNAAATSSSSSSEKQYAIELVPMREERCTVQRNGNDFFVTSLDQALRGVQCPTSMIIRNGDIIHPCDLEKMSDNPGNFRYKVEIISGATEGRKESMELDGSAFASASEKINKAAAVSNAAQVRPSDANPFDVKNSEKETAVQNPFDFDKDSLRQTFLTTPISTSKFFLFYCRNLSKNTSSINSNKKLGASVINAFIDAMSPRDHNRNEQQILGTKVESFPLRLILVILDGCEDAELGKRAIEGYVWLSCQKTIKKPTGFDPPIGPILLATPHLPLRKICEKNGWENMESVLVHSMEMLCKYQTSMFNRFAILIERVQPDASSVSADSAQLRVFFKLAKLFYEKWFPDDPEGAARHFTNYNDNISRKSSVINEKLVNAFVDAMSPSDIASRRVPKFELGYGFPLRRIIDAILVGNIGSTHKKLVKRVLEGYIWLSCQKTSSYSRTRGPLQMKDIVSLVCNKIGWNLIGDVLVESVEKLCDCREFEGAFTVFEEVMKESSRAGDIQSSLVCVRLAKATSKMFNSDQFQANPTATARLFCTQYKHLEKDSSNKELRDDVLNSFVDAMSPRDVCNRRACYKSLSGFPLKDILCVLVSGGHMKLGKRVLEGYVWLSSKGASFNGPELLESAGDPFVSLCDALGWDKLETILIKSSEMLCRSSNAQMAIRVIIKIAPDLSDGNSQRFRICSEMAKLACDKAIVEGERYRQFDKPYEIPFYKKLLWVLVNFCPTMAQKFVEMGKQFDVDNVLYPLLTDAALRSTSTADAMKDILNQLTEHCAQELHSRVSSDPNMVTAWTVSNAGSYSWTVFGEFLQSQCKQTFDYRVRKSDHKAFQQQLRNLVNSGEITCKSHQPYSSAYHFQITKLKTSRVHLNNLSCSCSSYDYNHKISQEPSDCLRDSSRKERAEAKAKLDIIKTFLATDSSLKRKAVDALCDDDDEDDVVLTGVAGVAETVAKRVKAAEDAGEVIEIL